MTAPAPGTAYGIPFLTLSNVSPVPAPTSAVVNFLTDAACLCSLDWWSNDDPSIVGRTTISDAAATVIHAITIPYGAGHTGRHINFRIYLAVADTSGLTLRPYDGTFQIPGARAAAGVQVPVRFYNFGGTPPPPAGGGNAPNGAPSPANGSNWNTYAWMQYNPNGKAFPS